MDASKATVIPKYADRIVQKPSRSIGQPEQVSRLNKRGNLDFGGTRFTGPLGRLNRNLQLWLTAEGLEA